LIETMVHKGVDLKAQVGKIKREKITA